MPEEKAARDGVVSGPPGRVPVAMHAWLKNPEMARRGCGWGGAAPPDLAGGEGMPDGFRWTWAAIPGVAGGWAGHGERGTLPRFRRGALRHGDGDRGGWRDVRPLRL